MQEKKRIRSLVFCVAMLAAGMFALNNVAVAQQVQVNVTNEICGYPLEGAEVEIAADAGKIEGLGVAITDANGVATFTNLPNAAL